MNAFIVSMPTGGLATPSITSMTTSVRGLRSATTFLMPFRPTSRALTATLSTTRRDVHRATVMDLGPFEHDGDEGSPTPAAGQSTFEETKLFVGNLSWDTTDSSLSAAFATYGTVIEARVIFDRYSGRSRGFGFVEFEDTETAQQALKGMNGFLVDGRAVRVDRATKRARRMDGPAST